MDAPRKCGLQICCFHFFFICTPFWNGFNVILTFSQIFCKKFRREIAADACPEDRAILIFRQAEECADAISFRQVLIVVHFKSSVCSQVLGSIPPPQRGGWGGLHFFCAFRSHENMATRHQHGAEIVPLMKCWARMCNI